MKLKGNFFLFFSTQLVSGLIAYPLLVKFNLLTGMLLSIIPVFIGMIATRTNYKSDEREFRLISIVDSFTLYILIFVMLLIYHYFPAINWFFAMYTIAGLLRGIIGLIVFFKN